MSRKEFVIPAEVHTEPNASDFAREVLFDAEPWFKQASDQQILKLAKDGFGYDYSADDVAYYFEGTNRQIANMFKYINKDDVGFEVSIWDQEAMEWIQKHRLGLFHKITFGTNHPLFWYPED